MKSVLILVLSCNRSPFREMMIAQMRTWDSLHQYGVSTVFYSGDSASVQWERNWLKVPAPDNYQCIGWKTKLAIEEVLKTPWDYFFRTNSSSYVCKKRLLEYVQTLPLTGYYGGMINYVGMINYGKYPPIWASGAGMLMSRDVAVIVQNGLNPVKSGDRVDDVEIGQICCNNGIRCDPHYPSSNDFHFRCRPAHDNRDGSEELVAFEMLFQNKKALYR